MSLEDKVNDKQSEGFLKKAAKLGYAGAMAGLTTMLSTAFVGTMGIFVGGALVAGSAIGSAIKKSKTLYQHVFDSLKTYANANLFIVPALKVWDWTMPFIPGSGLYGFLAKGTYAATAFNAYFTALTKGTKHLVDNYLNPIGIVDSVKHNFYNEWKRNAIGFAPGWYIAPQYPNLSIGDFTFPTFAANAFPLSLYNTLKPIPVREKSYTPKHGNALSAPAGAH